jgi:hypothetical protein
VLPGSGSAPHSFSKLDPDPVNADLKHWPEGPRFIVNADYSTGFKRQIYPHRDRNTPLFNPTKINEAKTNTPLKKMIVSWNKMYF